MGLLEVVKNNAQIETSLSSVEKKKLQSLAAASGLTSNSNNANNVRVQASYPNDGSDANNLEWRKISKSGDSISMHDDDHHHVKIRTKSRGFSADDEGPVIIDRMSLKMDSSKVLTAQIQKETRQSSPKRGATQRGMVNKLAVNK